MTSDPTPAKSRKGSFRCNHRSCQQLVEFGLVKLNLIEQPVEISNLVAQIAPGFLGKKQMCGPQ